MRDAFHLLITLKSSDGGKGVQKYTGPDSAPMEWDRPADGDGETTEAVIQLIDSHGEETDSHDMDGDDWRQFEDAGGPAKVLRWLNNPKFFGGLSSCIFAARMECDPDGWTEAHEEIERLQALLDARPVDDGGQAFPVPGLSQLPNGRVSAPGSGHVPARLLRGAGDGRHGRRHLARQQRPPRDRGPRLCDGRRDAEGEDRMSPRPDCRTGCKGACGQGRLPCPHNPADIEAMREMGIDLRPLPVRRPEPSARRRQLLLRWLGLSLLLLAAAIVFAYAGGPHA